MENRSIIYSDINENDPRFKVYNVQSIYQSIKNILSTKKGEKLFDPEYGFALEDTVFDLITENYALEVERLVYLAITKYEPRVNLDPSKSTVIPDYDGNGYTLDLYFTVEGLEGETFQYTGTIYKD